MKTTPISTLALLAFVTNFLPTGGVAQDQAERSFRQWDQNGDGVLVKSEVPEGPRRIFDRKDADGDGRITLAEHLGRDAPPPTRPEREPRGEAGEPTFTIPQTWNQEPDGFDRPVYAMEPAQKLEGTPVIIFFHGNGGNAGGQISNWARTFPERLVVAPQGYERSWNIQGERSEAPDVAFFKTLIAEIGERYPYADLENVSLIGSSNGAGYINRLMIEVEEDLFANAVLMVSSLIEAQHHDGRFWKPSADTASYDTPADPVGGRRILYLHGTADSVVPFDGGLRGRKFPHLAAHDTAYLWATEQGYEGAKLEEGDGTDLGNGLVVYEYPDSEVTFIAVQDGGHGLQPHRDAAIESVRQFLEE